MIARDGEREKRERERARENERGGMRLAVAWLSGDSNLRAIFSLGDWQLDVYSSPAGPADNSGPIRPITHTHTSSSLTGPVVELLQ